MKKNRLVEIGGMTTQVAFKELERLAGKIFTTKDKQKERDEAIQAEIAEIVFAKLSKLKGSGLKLLQAISLDEELLPRPYIEKFEKAYGKVAPLSRPIVKKVFKMEFGNNPEEVFKNFDYNPIAAASLGQVHRAQLKTGEQVVVKIQYPNIAENMQADMQMLSTVAKTLGNPLIRSTVEELAESLIAETDYTIEAKNLELFKNVEAITGIILPTLVAEFSGKKVITLSYIEGNPLHQLQVQQDLNRALEQILKFFFKTLNEGYFIHADPHPGNFLISEEHTGVVDFGSVKKNIPQKVVELFMLLLKQSDPLDLVELYDVLGAEVEISPLEFYDKYVRNYHNICCQIFNQDCYNFENSRSKISELRKILFLQSREKCLQGLSSDFTLLHKSLQSMLFMFCKYKGHICTKLES